jgi:hypothetical protein
MKIWSKYEKHEKVWSLGKEEELGVSGKKKSLESMEKLGTLCSVLCKLCSLKRTWGIFFGEKFPS